MTIPIPLHEVLALGVETARAWLGRVAVVMGAISAQRLRKGLALLRLHEHAFDRGVLHRQVWLPRVTAQCARVAQALTCYGLPGRMQGVLFVGVAQGVEQLGALQRIVTAGLHVGGLVGVL
ncbi:MAG: hypothetical protein EOO21_05505, partial [Comamonadaceae bacterium]